MNHLPERTESLYLQLEKRCGIFMQEIGFRLQVPNF